MEAWQELRFTSEQLQKLYGDSKAINWQEYFNFDVFPFDYCKSHAYTVQIRDAPRKVGRLKEPLFDPTHVLGIRKVHAAMDLMTLVFNASKVLFFVDIDMVVGQIMYIGIHSNEKKMRHDSIFSRVPIWELRSKIILIQTAGGVFTNMVTGHPVHFYEFDRDRKFCLAKFRCMTYCSMGRHDMSSVYENIPLFLEYTSLDGLNQMRVAYYDIELGCIFLGDLFYCTDVWNPCSMRRTEEHVSKYAHETIYDVLYCQGENNYDTVFTQSDNYARSQWQRINVEPMFDTVRKGIAEFCDSKIANDVRLLHTQLDFSEASYDEYW
jgi:hypothetical protein